MEKKELTSEERKTACADCHHDKGTEGRFNKCKKCGSSKIYNDPNPARLIEALRHSPGRRENK